MTTVDTEVEPPIGLSATAWGAYSNPRAIAMIGASAKRIATERFVHNNRDSGFAGNIYLINPNHDTLFDQKCWPSLSALPEKVDVALISVPRDKVPGIAQEAIDHGARALIIHAGGFSERGQAGVERQAELHKICTAAGVPALGPNCLGFRHFVNKVSISTFPPFRGQPGSVAAISQSGAVAMLIEALTLRVGLSFLASTGNEAVTATEDLIDCALDDPSTRIVVAFVEQLRRPRQLFALAEKAHAVNKPIVMLKVGLSDAGGRVSLGHTGALAGSGAVYKQALQQAGIIMVEDFDELAQTVELMLHVKHVPPRCRMAVLGISGGQLGGLADQATELGVELPPLAPATTAKIQELLYLPKEVVPVNPLDIGTSFASPQPYHEIMRDCIETLARDESIDMVGLCQQFYKESGPKLTSRNKLMVSAAARASKNTDKLVMVFSGVSGLAEEDVLVEVRAAGIPALQGSREALRAVCHLDRYGRHRAAGRRRRTSAIPASALGGLPALDGRMVPQAELFALLARLGVATTGAVRVSSAAEAERAVAGLGGPAVMKIDTSRVVHKSDVGGVALGVTPATAQLHFARLVACLEPPIGHSPGEGIIVARQLAEGVEFYIGAKRDDSFGAVVMCGIGGRLLEIVQKTALLIAPFDRALALAAIDRSGAKRLLEGFRGGPAAQLDALADMMVVIGDLAVALGNSLDVLDLNPVIVTRDQPGGCVADARLLLRPTPAPAAR